jgi:hypothetical protein
MPKFKPSKNNEYSKVSKGFIARYNWLRRTLLSGIRINCTEIAGQMGCTPKTAQRYINRLRRDGYDIIFDASALFDCSGQQNTRAVHRAE